MQNTTLKERLALFLKHLGIGQAAFSNNVGLSKGFANNVGDSIRTDNLNKITASYPELNTTWLLTGEGEMLRTKNIDDLIYNVGHNNILNNGGSVSGINNNNQIGNSGRTSNAVKSNDEALRLLMLENENLKRQLADKDKQLADKDKQLEDKDKLIAAKEETLAVYRSMLERK